MDIIETLLDQPYWIIDLLPKQVPAGSPGQYFAIEQYYLHKASIWQHKLNIILKLNCYYDVLAVVQETEYVNPFPETMEDFIRHHYLNIIVDGSLIVSDPDSTYLTVYQPNDALLSLLNVLASGNGMYVWKPDEMVE